jgi:hypothetical protein
MDWGGGLPLASLRKLNDDLLVAGFAAEVE